MGGGAGDGGREETGKGSPHHQTPFPMHTPPHMRSPLAPAPQGDPPVRGDSAHLFRQTAPRCSEAAGRSPRGEGCSGTRTRPAARRDRHSCCWTWLANPRAEWGTGFISFDPRNYPKTQKICPLTDRGHPYPIFSRGLFPSTVPGSRLSTEKELEICSLAGVEPDARELRCPVPVPTPSTGVGECRGQTAEGKTPLS